MLEKVKLEVQYIHHFYDHDHNYSVMNRRSKYILGIYAVSSQKSFIRAKDRFVDLYISLIFNNLLSTCLSIFISISHNDDLNNCKYIPCVLISAFKMDRQKNEWMFFYYRLICDREFNENIHNSIVLH